MDDRRLDTEPVRRCRRRFCQLFPTLYRLCGGLLSLVPTVPMGRRAAAAWCRYRRAGGRAVTLAVRGRYLYSSRARLEDYSCALPPRYLQATI
jgi:hypothetical protein